MQVTRSNFDAIVDEIVDLIGTCDFYAMDQEMTGIEVRDTGDSPLDSLADAYPNKSAAARRYNAFQIGICLFHRASDTNTYTVRPLNFWLRASSFRRAEVTLNLSAVDFLLSNGMDCQFWLSQGLPYVDAAGESRERAYHLAFDSRPVVDAAAEKWITSTLEKVSDWYGGAESELILTDRHVSVEADMALWHDLQSRKIAVLTEPSLISRVPPYARSSTVLKRATNEAVQGAAAAARAKSKQGFLSAIGFRSIFNAMTRCAAPMIGHNFSSDLMFLLQMHARDLPSSLTEFKSAVRAAFPSVYDTKTLAAMLPEVQIENTSLEPLFKELERNANAKDQFKLVFPIGFESFAPEVVRKMGSKSCSVAHQGAYDAYMTGVVYLRFLHQYGSEAVRRLQNVVSVFGSPYLLQLEKDTESYIHQWTCHVFIPPQSGISTRRELELALLSPAARVEREKNPKSRLPFRLYSVPGNTSAYVVTSPQEDPEVVARAAAVGIEITDLNSWRINRQSPATA